MSLDDLRPTFEPLPLRCKACCHEWQAWHPQNVPIATWIAHIRSLRCPQCFAGSKRLVIRINPETAA